MFFLEVIAAISYNYVKLIVLRLPLNFRKVISLLLYLGLIFILPFIVYGIDNEGEKDIRELHLPRRYLDGVKEAQQTAFKLHSLAFCRKAYKPTEGNDSTQFTAQQREELKALTLKFEYLVWDIKQQMDGTFREEDDALRHTPPLFDDEGNLIQEADVHHAFIYVTQKGPNKVYSHKKSNIDFIFQHSHAVHEIAYRSMMRFLGRFLQYLFCCDYPDPQSPPPSKLSIKDLEQLRNNSIGVGRQSRDIAEPYLSKFGFDLTYDGKPISLLASLHISDQSNDSFRASIREYKRAKTVSDEHLMKIYEWYSIKLSRLNRALCGFRIQISDVFDFLQNINCLREPKGLQTERNGLLPNCRFINFRDFLFRGLKFTPKTIPYPTDVLARVQKHFRAIWPRGVNKGPKFDNQEMLKLFCDIMEERATISLETNIQLLPGPLRAITKSHIQAPKKTHAVTKKARKRKIELFKTYPFEITLTSRLGLVEEFSMDQFISKWESLTTRQQQVLLSLQLFELISTHVEKALYTTYKNQLDRIFKELKDPTAHFPDMINLIEIWAHQSNKSQQANNDKVHVLTHMFSPGHPIPAILGLMQYEQSAYTGVTSGLFFKLNEEELQRYQKDRRLVNSIMGVLKFYSSLIPLPAPTPPWAPGEWSAYMNIVPDAPPLPEGVTWKVAPRTNSNLKNQIVSSPLCMHLNPPVPLHYRGKDMRSKVTRPLREELIAKIKSRALRAYDRPLQKEEGLFQGLYWDACSYYSNSLPKSWVLLDMYDGPEENEYINSNFDAFFEWYWNLRH